MIHRILIIDDEAPNLDLLSRMLRSMAEVQVDTEVDSGKALQSALDTEYDVIITDIVMPEPDGLVILEQVKKRWPETEVVMLSGLMTVDRAVEALKLRAFDFVPKPVEIQKFRNTIHLALERRRLVLDNARMNRELQEHAQKLQFEVDQATRQLTDKVSELDILSAHLRAILDNIPSGCVVIKSSGEVFQINKAAAQILGLPEPTQAHGTPLPQTFRLDPLVDFIQNAPSTPRTTIRLPADEELPSALVEIALSRVHSGEDEFIVLIVNDVTERWELQQRVRAHERLAAVGGLASGIAHEIKNPLGAIRGLGELLSMKIEAVVALKKFSDNIMNEVDRLTKIINDISRFSRDVTPARQDVGLARLIEELAADYRDRPGGSRITVEIDRELPDFPYDYVHLRQAIEAIVDNALRATEEEEGKIVVTAHTEPSSTTNVPEVVISVWDDGVGIPEDNLQNLFKPFFSTRKAKGSGLGLTIAEKVVSDHGGTIDISSTEGQGTTVVIRVPALNSNGESLYESSLES